MSHAQRKGLVTAGLITYIAITPGWIDAHSAWFERPETRPLLIGWFVGLGVMALLYGKEL